MSDLDRLDALRTRFDAQPQRFGAPYAEALRRAGRSEEALGVIRGVIDAQPRNVFGQVVLARCLRDQGHPEEAGVVVRTALALDATDAMAQELDYLVAFAPRAPEASVPAPIPEAPAEGEVDRDQAEVFAPPVPPAAVPRPTPAIFVTETMAELYVQQGLPERALAIYRELTARAPGDARLAARLAEVAALAAAAAAEAPAPSLDTPSLDTPSFDAPSADTPSVETWGAEDDWGDALLDLPLLEDFDPAPLAESEPESLDDSPALGSAFDFSGDAHREDESILTAEEPMLAGLSFDAISLATPSTGAAGLDLPTGTGPSAREALRQLAARQVALRPERRAPVVPPPSPAPRATARRSASAPAAPARAVTRPPADPLGDDFDQWLRGVS